MKKKKKKEQRYINVRIHKVEKDEDPPPGMCHFCHVRPINYQGAPEYLYKFYRFCRFCRYGISEEPEHTIGMIDHR